MNEQSFLYAAAHMVLFVPFIFYFLFKKITHPVVIFIGILSFQYSIYAFFQEEKYSILTDVTVNEIFYGLWAFLVGFTVVTVLSFSIRSHLRFKLSPNFHSPNESLLFKINQRVKILSVIVIVAHLFIGFNHGVNGVYESFWINVRMEHVNSPQDFYLFPHLAIFCQSWFVYCFVHKYKKEESLICLILVTLFCSISKLERTSIISLVLTILVLKDHMHYNGLSLKALLISLFAVVGVFIFVAAQFYASSSFSDLLFVMLDYFAKNLDTFNKHVSSMPPTYNANLILGPFAKFFIFDEKTLVPIKVDTDDSFNTYSYLMNLHMFGGGEFVMVFNLLIGCFFSLVYELRYAFNGLVLGFFSFFSCALFLSFFAYTFSWSNWLYYAICFFIIHLIVRRNIKDNNRKRCFNG
ncbi:O-antigen polymerase [Aeromonas hydrophila]|nr:oligosaccharide repeat unit polymerase [Aeromonas hydrophila subsp. hydrophila]